MAFNEEEWERFKSRYTTFYGQEPYVRDCDAQIKADAGIEILRNLVRQCNMCAGNDDQYFKNVHKVGDKLWVHAHHDLNQGITPCRSSQIWDFIWPDFPICRSSFKEVEPKRG